MASKGRIGTMSRQGARRSNPIGNRKATTANQKYAAILRRFLSKTNSSRPTMAARKTGVDRDNNLMAGLMGRNVSLDPTGTEG